MAAASHAYGMARAAPGIIKLSVSGPKKLQCFIFAITLPKTFYIKLILATQYLNKLEHNINHKCYFNGMFGMPYKTKSSLHT